MTENINTVAASYCRTKDIRYKLQFSKRPIPLYCSSHVLSSSLQKAAEIHRREKIVYEADMVDAQLRDGVIGAWKHREIVLRMMGAD